MNSNSFVPNYFKHLIKRMGITLLMLTLTRIIFLISNYSNFPSASPLDFFAGIWMDCIAIGIWFIPFYGLSLFPQPYKDTRFFQLFLKGLFHIINTLMIAFNLLDVEYFKYTAKRSTSDVFTFLSAGEDLSQLIGTFFVDFWWLFLILIALIWLSNFLYNKTIKKELTSSSYLLQTIVFLVGCFVFFIMGRGGFGFRPADMLTASQFTKPSNTALVLNTPLSIIKTIGKTSLLEVDYFKDESKLYNPIHEGSKEHKLTENLNVMVLILESFGNEWLGEKMGGPYTPFLDSLIDESLYFSNAFANGKKSIEAVPAIFGSIPSLLDNPYISSHYGMNQIASLPRLLKEQGYSSAFYHGATNGSMKFDVFASHSGFDKYFGRYEYNNEAHYDETWGILDEYFMPWTAQNITKELKEPFLASLFTISSHHPYFVPKEYRDHLPKGPHPMAQSIAYGDQSLKLFFEEAKKQPWYDNTLFVICADHTPAGNELKYTQRIGMYQIPILFYSPNNKIPSRTNDQLFNQIDIMPTILDYIGYKSNYYAFGNSFFNNRTPFVINYISNTYHFLENDYMINFVGDETVGLYNYKKDELMKYDSLEYYKDKALKMEQRLKSIIQRYNYDLIHNEMIAK
jgi:phosphoglycerol transferase MdoB-like AlkP superfamily enzyme